MKKYLFLVLSAFFVGCASVSPYVSDWNKSVLFGAYDFRPYVQQGFLFYPHEYKASDFDVMGMVFFEMIPTVKRIACPNSEEMIIGYEQNGVKYRQVYHEGVVYCFLIDKADQHMLIQSCYDKCVEMGADALVDFKIMDTEKSNGGIMFPTITASGVAIKRK